MNVGEITMARLCADKAAIIDYNGEAVQKVTYGELDCRANRVARELLGKRLRRGERVAVIAANSSSFIAAHLGIMRAGLISVPVNFKLPRQLINYILDDCDAKLVICDEARESSIDSSVQRINVSIACDLRDASNFGSFKVIDAGGDDACMFLYTSGSTGRPKGVILSHGSQEWTVQKRLEQHSAGSERFLVAAPLYHLNALAIAHLVLSAGSSMVLLPEFQTSVYAEAVERFECTWLTAVPPMIAMLLRDSAAIAGKDFSSVSHLRMGSAPVGKRLAEDVRRIFANAKIVNAYGTTEGGPIVFVPSVEEKIISEGALGLRHPEVELRLDGKKVEGAAEGVLELKSPGMMSGYHKRPDLAASVTTDGYYITGDRFRRDKSGVYYFLGRADDMMVCGGENVFPVEVERIMEKHPDVLQCCVVPIDDLVKGQKPVAFVRLRDGAVAGADELKEFFFRNGASYQHPRYIWFLGEMPVGSTNKVDRKALTEAAQKRVRDCG